MAETIRYKFLYSAPGEEPVLVRHDTRPGDAEGCARKMARLVAKKKGWPEVSCVWYGPNDEPLPPRIREEIRRTRTP